MSSPNLGKARLEVEADLRRLEKDLNERAPEAARRGGHKVSAAFRQATANLGASLGGVGGAAGLGGLVGGMGGNAVFGALHQGAQMAERAVSAYLASAERGTESIIKALDKARQTGKALEGVTVSLREAMQVENAAKAWEKLPLGNDQSRAAQLAPWKENTARGLNEALRLADEAGKSIQSTWDAIPTAIQRTIPGVQQFATWMGVAEDAAKKVQKASAKQAAKDAAEFERQQPQRAKDEHTVQVQDAVGAETAKLREQIGLLEVGEDAMTRLRLQTLGAGKAHLQIVQRLQEQLALLQRQAESAKALGRAWEQAQRQGPRAMIGMAAGGFGAAAGVGGPGMGIAGGIAQGIAQAIAAVKDQAPAKDDGGKGASHVGLADMHRQIQAGVAGGGSNDPVGVAKEQLQVLKKIEMALGKPLDINDAIPARFAK